MKRVIFKHNDFGLIEFSNTGLCPNSNPYQPTSTTIELLLYDCITDKGVKIIISGYMSNGRFYINGYVPNKKLIKMYPYIKWDKSDNNEFFNIDNLINISKILCESHVTPIHQGIRSIPKILKSMSYMVYLD